ncbi:glycosaminoglycan xylosylkinase-like [Cimex lectularius]|uniref:FAM20 C-terminal domain-containing protein n=1 Tax=Cimex lectularius TaxID=79782 RepID=A0A8I6RXZ5_CIMLE|nr:glycosaminoglycan xylosylkinase-like [Cimex lectularius]
MIEKIAKRYKCILAGLGVVVIFNLHLLYSLAYDGKKIPQNEEVHKKLQAVGNGQYENSALYMQNTSFQAMKNIEATLSRVSLFFTQKYSTTYHNFSTLLINRSLPPRVNLWQAAANWVTPTQIAPKSSTLLPHVLRALETGKILSANITSKGSQLKLLLMYEKGQKVLFKPKWYERDKVILGKPYAGKDRHNGEIAAFHLARLLGLNRAPIVSGRIVNLKEDILPVATYDLSRTFYKNGSNTCFYGVCLYCKPTDGVCADGALLEGSVTLWLPEHWKLVRLRHPWQRSYTSSFATWELYTDYCSVIRKSKMYKDEDKILDLIEISVFDFLIGNGDRHHYEMFEAKGSKALLIDNGKSFGNPHVDFIDTLAPLYQCCRIREEFVSVLASLRDGQLSNWLEVLLSSSPLSPVLTKEHFEALDRRVNIVLAAILYCINEKGEEEVLVTGL